jgi:hypothetical protein
MQDMIRYAWQSAAKYCQALHGSAKNKKHFYMQISIILLQLLPKILHISFIITYSYIMQGSSMSCECVLENLLTFVASFFMSSSSTCLYAMHGLGGAYKRDNQ